eukprot:Anaeramoba_ignava/a217489_66.p1 GENE.a217489_66~~a217489_66.p1  ORF type:complete len:161 (+),score=32.12 a217489_66:136-618(+)
MTMNKWLWALWGAMIASMFLKGQADTYMVVAVIVLPILIVLLDLHEEIATLKEENKHQRKFVMDRYNILQDKLKDLSSNIEKRMVVDFAEFARKNQEDEDFSAETEKQKRIKASQKKKKRKEESEENDFDEFSNIQDDFDDFDEENENYFDDSDEDYEDI